MSPSSKNPYSYLDLAALPYPFCPGCGHGGVLDRLDEALRRLQVDPNRVVIVTDIGCAGLSDRFFATHAMHGLHGRAVTYATGIKLARPELKVIVLMGDGGCGIGGHHLLNAARRNIGVTVLVFNNLNYGMTGGEHSVTTPSGAVTATTPFGNLEQPMDICATVTANGAAFAARLTSFDDDLSELIVQALSVDGFALLDIWELCAAYFAPRNRLNRRALEGMMEEQGFSQGVIGQRERQEYSRAYREAVRGQAGLLPLPARPLEVKYNHALEMPLHMLIAGAAGMRVGTAAAAFSRGALLSGLWARQRDDYPVTVRSGFSASEVFLSPEEDYFAGDGSPDWLVVLFEEGLKKVRLLFADLSQDAVVYIQSDLLPVETPAKVIPLHLSKTGKKTGWSLAALAAILGHTGIYPLEALRQAATLKEAHATENLRAIQAGVDKVIS